MLAAARQKDSYAHDASRVSALTSGSATGTACTGTMRFLGNPLLHDKSSSTCMVMVFPHTAIVVNVTPTGFYMAGSVVLTLAQEPLFAPIETI